MIKKSDSIDAHECSAVWDEQVRQQQKTDDHSCRFTLLDAEERGGGELLLPRVEDQRALRVLEQRREELDEGRLRVDQSTKLGRTPDAIADFTRVLARLVYAYTRR